MALSDASGDSVALGNGGHHNLSANGNGPSNSSTPVSSGQDPLTAADCLPDGDQEVVVKDGGCKVQQRSHVVQRTNRPSQNGGVVKQKQLPEEPSPILPQKPRLLQPVPVLLLPLAAAPPPLLPALSLPLPPVLPLWTAGLPPLPEPRHRPRVRDGFFLPLLPLCLHILFTPMPILLTHPPPSVSNTSISSAGRSISRTRRLESALQGPFDSPK
ncbi:hypothetical protein KUCAC02_020164, partial [Chaenocephalus aceratus]